MCFRINPNGVINNSENAKADITKPALKTNNDNKISSLPANTLKNDLSNFNLIRGSKILANPISLIDTTSTVNKSANNLSNAEIFQKIESLQEKSNITKGLSPKQKADIEKFNPDQKKMFVKALQEMENFKDGKSSASDYMMNLIQYSADLSGNDSKKFINLVGDVFSEVPDALDFFRKVLGAGPKTAGGILEPIYEGITKTHGGAGTKAGFNENITDDIDINNTITHHIGEFLQVGFNRGESLGKFADDIIDRDVKIIGMKLNEGDIRSAYFASMLGHALKENKVSPQQAVNMIKWTYTINHTGNQPPPFGTKKIPGHFTKWNDYKLNDWVKSYNKAFPNDKLAIH